jgi:hypothetical protein
MDPGSDPVQKKNNDKALTRMNKKFGKNRDGNRKQLSGLKSIHESSLKLSEIRGKKHD